MFVYLINDISCHLLWNEATFSLQKYYFCTTKQNKAQRTTAMIVVVSGMTQPENIRQVADLGVDILGFDFRQGSARYVRGLSSLTGTIPDIADQGIYSSLTGMDVKKVGMFTDEMPQMVITQVYNYGLDYVQFRGNESPTYIENLRHTLVPDIAPKLGFIKTIMVGTPADVGKAKEYEGKVEMLVFHRKHKSLTESEQKAFWQWVEDYDGSTPFLLSGGIDLTDAEDILRVRHRYFAGVNINFMFESSVGVKDVEKIGKMVSKLRGA